jgi:hypothetical protein
MLVPVFGKRGTWNKDNLEVKCTKFYYVWMYIDDLDLLPSL